MQFSPSLVTKWTRDVVFVVGGLVCWAQAIRLACWDWIALGARCSITLLCAKAVPLGSIFSVSRWLRDDDTIRATDPLSNELPASRCFLDIKDALPFGPLLPLEDQPAPKITKTNAAHTLGKIGRSYKHKWQCSGLYSLIVLYGNREQGNLLCYWGVGVESFSLSGS